MPSHATILIATLLFSTPLLSVAQPPPPPPAAEAPCPAQSLFPIATVDGSSIGITNQCVRDCLLNANACVCGSQNPFNDRPCICLKDAYEFDVVGCAQSCNAAAQVNTFLTYKRQFCAGQVAPPTVTAPNPQANATTVPTGISSTIAVSTTALANATTTAVATTSAATRAPLPTTNAPAKTTSASVAGATGTPSDAAATKQGLGLSLGLLMMGLFRAL